MEINVSPSIPDQPCERAFAITMTIRSFKGRKDVDIHLFRHFWDQSEEHGLDWPNLLGDPIPGSSADPVGSRHVLMESFTEDERDEIIGFLAEKYESRLTSITSRPLNFPIPLGLPALSGMSEGKNIGFIRFEKIPSYSLDINLRGLYDLSQHQPIVEVKN